MVELMRNDNKEKHFTKLQFSVVIWQNLLKFLIKPRGVTNNNSVYFGIYYKYWLGCYFIEIPLQILKNSLILPFMKKVKITVKIYNNMLSRAMEFYKSSIFSLNSIQLWLRLLVFSWNVDRFFIKVGTKLAFVEIKLTS